MRIIDRIYIDGEFVEPHGREEAPLHNPATEERIGAVRLGDAQDVARAVAAAKRVFPDLAATSKPERIAMLEALAAAVTARRTDLEAAMREEYGAPAAFIEESVRRASTVYLDMAATLQAYDFRRSTGRTQIEMRPLGVAAAITPWNSNYGAIGVKLAASIAAGCPMVVKPSELSAIQTHALAESLHAAGLPRGVINIVNGAGAEAGAALSAHPDVAKITFTGSTVAGHEILRAAAADMKRVTLELGGKGASLILDDADLDCVLPQVLAAGLVNSGQACVAGTRILAPQSRLAEIEARLAAALPAFKVGSDPSACIGPMVSLRQWERVQSYIRLGLEEGANLISGGEGRPPTLPRGWFVRPTLFSRVHNNMRIAREEIFGPVLCVIPYRDDAEAVAIANDSAYGLQAYVFSADEDRARRVADRVEAGRVVINAAPHDPSAPFGGFKLSGLGRELGAFGLESFMEPRAMLA